MKNPWPLALLVISLSLAACSLSAPTQALQPAPAETNSPAAAQLLSPTTTHTPTATAVPPTATVTPSPTPAPLPVEYPQPGTVVLDFVALACRARWANGAYDIPCPGNPQDVAEGFIAPADQAVAEGGIPVEAPSLVGLPGAGGEHGAGLFGIYSPLLIQPGDTFHTWLACQEGTACEVEFALEYIDARGKYQHDMNWSWKHKYGGGAVPVQADLSALAGQTVQLILVVRDQGTPLDDWVLWIYPYVARLKP